MRTIYGIMLLTFQGPVEFNSNGSRDARVIRVQQYRVTSNNWQNEVLGCVVIVLCIVLS